MNKLLQIDFSIQAPFGAQMSEAFEPLAQSIAQERGLIWKIWTENAQTKEAGGIYLFDDEECALSYLQMHTERLKSFGITPINAKIFDINIPLSLIDRAPLF
jgi:hypothetical protein